MKAYLSLKELGIILSEVFKFSEILYQTSGMNFKKISIFIKVRHQPKLNIFCFISTKGFRGGECCAVEPRAGRRVGELQLQFSANYLNAILDCRCQLSTIDKQVV